MCSILNENISVPAMILCTLVEFKKWSVLGRVHPHVYAIDHVSRGAHLPSSPPPLISVLAADVMKIALMGGCGIFNSVYRLSFNCVIVFVALPLLLAKSR